MSPKIALSIGAVVAVIFGLLLVFAPVQMLAGFGLKAPDEGVILSRDVGSTLIGLGIINWLARNEIGPAVRALLIGNAFIQIAELVVNGWEVARASSQDRPRAGSCCISCSL